MNRERAAELLPIIQAFAEGKVIQWQYDDEPNKDTWRIVLYDEGVTERTDVIYRIKPEPEVIYVNKRKNGGYYQYSSYDMAVAGLKGIEDSYEYIAKKFQEVME